MRRRPTTLKESQSLSIDWEKHQALIIGLRATGEDTDETVTTDDDMANTAERPDNDEPLDKMVVADLPYNRDLSGEDWKTFEDYLAYIEYQN